MNTELDINNRKAKEAACCKSAVILTALDVTMGILHSNDPVSKQGRNISRVWPLSHIRSAFQTAIVCCSNTGLSQRLIMFSAAVIIVFLGLISGTSVATTLPKGMGGALPRQGNVIPAENRPCVDCHAFEFLERALQDINQATYNLDTQAEKLVLRTEDRGRCKCIE